MQLPSQPATSTHCAAQWTPATVSLFTSRLGSCCNVCFTDRMHTCRWTEVKMNSCMRGSGGAWDGTNYMQHPAFCPLLDFFLMWSSFYVRAPGWSLQSIGDIGHEIDLLDAQVVELSQLRRFTITPSKLASGSIDPALQDHTIYIYRAMASDHYYLSLVSRYIRLY
jgi:hypothetical protein